MALTPGTRIGSYEVAERIGVGGMGEVYRATDTNLGRHVAIKVLPVAVAEDAERVARFDREARTLASLNHPNIATIHGVERSEGVAALVMELVEGPTLAERIAQGPMPVDEALPVARQIAEALEAAHEQGIVHRDLKPANVKVRPDGTVKVLDFGLAKAMEGPRADANATHSPTLSLAAHLRQGYGGQATQQGLILGTAAYMSPEQARGQQVDRRTDVWAFGCVLFEMLTGRPAFPGTDVTDILAAVVRAEPDWSGLPADVGPRLRELIARCLKKDVRQRKQSIGDVRADLELASAGTDVPAAAAATTTPGGRRTIAVGAALFALGVVLAAIVMWPLTRSSPPEPRVAQFSFDLSSPVGELQPGRLAISPDGSTLAYVADAAGQTGGGARGQLYLRAVRDLESRPVPGATGASSLFFSPDGAWVGFVSGGYLMKASVRGGEPLRITKAFQAWGVSWGPGDQIVYGGGLGFGLTRVSADGGDPELVTELDPTRGEMHHGLPEILPDGDTVLFTIGTSGGSRLAKVSIATREVEELLSNGAGARYLDPGYLVFSQNGNLRVVSFDPQSATITGSVAPAKDGVQWRSLAGLEVADFASSRAGDLVFVPGSLYAPNSRMVWVDQDGGREDVGYGGVPMNGPELSPDGKRIAFMRYGAAAGIGEIWVVNADGTQPVRVANEGADYNPLWRPDGTTLTYTSNGDVFEKMVDEDRDRMELLRREAYLFPQSWSSDGQLAFMEFSSAGYRLWVLPRDGDPEPLADASFNSGGGQFAPVGDLLAYVTDESGQYEVYVRRYPGERRGIQVSRGGGGEPVWSADGRELYYRQGDRMIAARVTTEPELSSSEYKVLWEHPYFYQSPLWPNYDVDEDGRFLVLEPVTPSDAGATQVNVFLGWLADVERRLRGE